MTERSGYITAGGSDWAAQLHCACLAPTVTVLLRTLPRPGPQEAACKAAGVAIGEDSAAMIAFADKLPEEQLRTMCAVQSGGGGCGGQVGEILQ